MFKTRRDVFQEQPGQCVLFDLYPTIPLQIMDGVVNDITNVLKFGETLRGSPRIPAFGLYVLEREPRTIFQLDTIKPNFPIIKNSLTAVNSINLLEAPPLSEFPDILQISLQTMINDCTDLFNRYNSPGCKTPNAMQITLITMKEPHYLLALLGSLSESLHIIRIKNIFIKSLFYDDVNDRRIINSSDFAQIINCPLSLYLKTWLRNYESSTDVAVKFPSSFGDFTLECNLQECVLPPSILPYGHAYQLQTDALSIQLGGASRNSMNSVVPVHYLEVVNRMPQGALSDISVIGVPYTLTPTTSVEVSWQSLEENASKFKALCHALGTSEECLLCRQCYREQDKQDRIYGRFIIIPGNDMMIVQSLAVSELVQPFIVKEIVTGFLDAEATAFTSKLLGDIPLLKEYNPSEHSSGLYDQISVLATTNFFSEKKKSLKKPRAYPQRLQDNVPNHSNESRKTANFDNNQNTYDKTKDSEIDVSMPSTSKATITPGKKPKKIKKRRTGDFYLPKHPAAMDKKEIAQLKEKFKHNAHLK